MLSLPVSMGIEVTLIAHVPYTLAFTAHAEPFGPMVRCSFP